MLSCEMILSDPGSTISNFYFGVWSHCRSVDKHEVSLWVERTPIFISKLGQNRSSTAKSGFLVLSHEILLPDQTWAHSIDLCGIKVDWCAVVRTELARRVKRIHKITPQKSGQNPTLAAKSGIWVISCEIMLPAPDRTCSFAFLGPIVDCGAADRTYF